MHRGILCRHCTRLSTGAANIKSTLGYARSVSSCCLVGLRSAPEACLVKAGVAVSGCGASTAMCEEYVTPGHLQSYTDSFLRSNGMMKQGLLLLGGGALAGLFLSGSMYCFGGDGCNKQDQPESEDVTFFIASPSFTGSKPGSVASMCVSAP